MKIKRKDIIIVITIIATITIFLECKGFPVIEAFAQTEKANLEKIEKALAEYEETTYIIVDVVNYVYNGDFNGNTYLYCQMPDGSLQVYSITDAPEPNPKCTIACLATEDIEDYAVYRVVAVR